MQDTSVRYGDFPAGLSQLAGDFIFDASRITFSNVTSETGGGRLQLSGSLTYGNRPVSYDLTARTEQVRVRYPVGMSWLAGGNLRLLGTHAGSHSFRDASAVDRLLMSQGFDVTSLLASSTETSAGPTTTSPFLRNLQFDVQANTTPGAVMEWSSGRFQTEANVRVRGTFDHPILLGNIHLLNGQMTMRGNDYHLTRGDMNFVNPFRADPVLNVEVATTIQQYEVTVDFTGPASHLTMSYRSDPPLPSSDIITLLALGQTGEESSLRGGAAASADPPAWRHHVAFRSHLLPTGRARAAAIWRPPFQRRSRLHRRDQRHPESRRARHHCRAILAQPGHHLQHRCDLHSAASHSDRIHAAARCFRGRLAR